MAKKIYFYVIILFFILLIFLTFFKEEIFINTAPSVISAKSVISYANNGEAYEVIPKSALTKDGCLYVIETQQGFSQKLSYIKKQKIKFQKSDEIKDTQLILKDNLNKNQEFVYKIENNINKYFSVDDLFDGMRVILK